jgi:hypothetical protein
MIPELNHYEGENSKSYAGVFKKITSICILHFEMLENLQ